MWLWHKVVVVVEARERSGSLITADCALEQGRDVYAVPGRISDPLSAGCNRLIRQGAGIFVSVEDFLAELNLCGGAGQKSNEIKKLSLEKEERLVYSCLGLRPKSIEEILRETEISMPGLLQILAALAQKGFIIETFKNCYIRHI